MDLNHEALNDVKAPPDEDDDGTNLQQSIKSLLSALPMLEISEHELVQGKVGGYHCVIDAVYAIIHIMHLYRRIR